MREEQEEQAYGDIDRKRQGQFWTHDTKLRERETKKESERERERARLRQERLLPPSMCTTDTEV